MLHDIRGFPLFKLLDRMIMRWILINLNFGSAVKLTHDLLCAATAVVKFYIRVL